VVYGQGLLKCSSFLALRPARSDNLPAGMFANLKKLSLSRISVGNTDPSPWSQRDVPSQLLAKPRLESPDLRDIHITEQVGVLEAMRSALDISRLRNVCVFSDTPNIVGEAIKDSSDSLETFTWSHSSGGYIIRIRGVRIQSG